MSAALRGGVLAAALAAVQLLSGCGAAGHVGTTAVASPTSRPHAGSSVSPQSGRPLTAVYYVLVDTDTSVRVDSTVSPLVAVNLAVPRGATDVTFRSDDLGVLVPVPDPLCPPEPEERALLMAAGVTGAAVGKALDAAACITSEHAASAWFKTVGLGPAVIEALPVGCVPANAAACAPLRLSVTVVSS